MTLTFFFNTCITAIIFLSQSLRASVVQLQTPGNYNYCSKRELREYILCFEKVFPHEGITN